MLHWCWRIRHKHQNKLAKLGEENVHIRRQSQPAEGRVTNSFSCRLSYMLHFCAPPAKQWTYAATQYCLMQHACILWYLYYSGQNTNQTASIHPYYARWARAHQWRATCGYLCGTGALNVQPSMAGQVCARNGTMWALMPHSWPRNIEIDHSNDGKWIALLAIRSNGLDYSFASAAFINKCNTFIYL